MSEMQFVIGDRLVTAETLIANAPRAKREKREAPEKFHRGFRVEGHPPGAIESARLAHEQHKRDFDTASPEARADGRMRDPGLWNEQRWRNTTRKKAVRSRPYELSDAADQCREMAIKAGWTDVVVTAVCKGLE